MRETAMSGNRRSGSADGDWSTSLPNSLTGLKHALNGLSVWLGQQRVGVEIENSAQLVFEEIVTNIIRYGHSDEQEHLIRAAAAFSKHDLTLTFDDDGRPFDPRAAPELARVDSLVEASIGGRGLMLVRAAASSMAYERTSDGHNRLTVVLSSQ